MPKSKTQKFLVVIQSPAPLLTNQQQVVASSSWAYPHTTVKTVVAESAKDAAESCNPPAGATVYVAGVQYVATFKRPKVAPLEAA